MENITRRFNNLIANTATDFIRYLFYEIDWNDRLIVVKGSRGVGKTTMLLQHIKLNFSLGQKVLYVSMDDLYFQVNTLVDLAEEFYQNGGEYLYLDEVHKYQNWSIEIKNIYDNYPKMHIVFTSSSLLQIYKGEADLSRRAVSYELPGLSFREYLFLENKIDLKPISLDDIMKNHIQIASDITNDFRIIPVFKKYLQMGYYPYYLESESSYFQKLSNVVNLTLETDVPAVFNTEYRTIYKLKKLLYVIAKSVPYQPNITKLSAQIDTKSRSSTLQYLNYLERAKITINLKTSAKGSNYLVKPDKIYLENTNLMYAIGDVIKNEGNIRETFFINQLKIQYPVNTSKESDFLIDKKYTFEVGGKNKKTSQIKGLENAFIAADNIEIGFGNKIPLWMFGLMY